MTDYISWHENVRHFQVLHLHSSQREDVAWTWQPVNWRLKRAFPCIRFDLIMELDRCCCANSEWYDRRSQNDSLLVCQCIRCIPSLHGGA